MSPHRVSSALLATALLLGPGAAASAPDPSPAGLAERLAAESRSAEDRARDDGRRPAAVIAFLGIEPGMTVVDLIAASGYYTEVLSLAVGPEGTVYAQNPPFVLEMRDGANEKALSARLAGGRLANVRRVDRELAELELQPGSVDAALTALNFHDVHNSRGPEAAHAFLTRVRALLKPGGVLGIIDHAGGVGDDKELHRIAEALVIEAARRAGFEVEASSDLLRNPDDDLRRNVFEDGLRGHTDRFLLRLRKPGPGSPPEAR